jgi:cysteinyl-tRNA synthetase
LEKFEHDKLQPVKWYTCGPTIYSSAHLGHARTFISFDIVRRVMTYLGYNIVYVMNITDIDDKIINKVKELSPDAQCDNDVYMNFIKKMEAEFWTDMDRLGNLRPTVVTRVTEYIDKIKEYIEVMESNGLTYTANGTVYINSKQYVEHGYTWDIFNRCSTTEYTECEFSAEKKNPMDFSLWKASKPGEIKFASKWGDGRPSWHIECSAMSSDILGKTIDIHSGGIDLIYPHHANEIIQSISHENCNDLPIKCFLHSGHLNINGEKMAKSLGNFVTINNFLENVGTSRQLRLLFALHTWNKPMDFTDDVINEIKQIEKRIVDFYANIEYLIRSGNKVVTTYGTSCVEYMEFIIKTKQQIEIALMSNIDTKTVINIILNAISTTYKYVENSHNITLVMDIVKHITMIFDVLGISFLAVDKHDYDTDKFIDIVVDFRDDIRKITRENIKVIPKPVSGEIFKALDDVRDNKLKPLGVIIEDFGFGKKNKWTKQQV